VADSEGAPDDARLIPHTELPVAVSGRFANAFE
jgi:hypothetical protein